jgi:metal-responsive CopG/Arc/MetJ family transcriptional regulator
MATVNISFQDELLSDIDKLAQNESRTRSELLREAARMYIERKRRWEMIFSYGGQQVAKKKVKEKDVLQEIRSYRRRKMKT